jgi:hypothetical protein
MARKLKVPRPARMLMVNKVLVDDQQVHRWD